MKYNHHTSVVRAACLFLLAGGLCILPASAGGYDKTAEEYDRLIAQLYQNQHMDSVKLVLDEALKLYPNDTDLNRWAGTYFLQRKEKDNARYFLIKAVEQDADNFQAKQQLATLEEELGNLSSAICYVNEMLELYPYDQALWKKKIGLYRKQGNTVEADRLLERLQTIYPNDTTVQRDYRNRMEETYMQQRKEGNRGEAIETLRKLMEVRPKEKEYYLDLSNMLLQEGHSEEAVAVLSKGLEYFPEDPDLLKKKADLMAARGYSKEAVEMLRKNRSASLLTAANELMLEAARTESWKDPYTLYGRVYESSKSAEALDYLLRTSISRGYHEDALYYLSEYRKKYGNTPEVYYREYRIFKQNGEEKSAMRALENYIGLKPTDREMADELAAMKVERADRYMDYRKYDEARADLKQAMTLTDDRDRQASIAGKWMDCCLQSNKHAEAILLIDSIRGAWEDQRLYTEQKAEALHRMGASEQALGEMEKNGMTDSETYETISTDYVKRLLEEGATDKAYRVSKHWTETVPQSQQGLMYAIRTAEEVGEYGEADHYIGQGRKLYPEEPFFVLKEAAVLYRNKEYGKGMELLAPWADSQAGNKEITGAYAAHIEGRVEELLKEKEKKADEALSLTRKALEMNPTNQELWLAQGRAYEMKEEYDSAYSSYARFSPEPLWVKEHRRTLMRVQRKGYRNMISTDVLTGWYSDGRQPNTILSMAYSRKFKRDFLTVTANISCRNTNFDDTEAVETTTDTDPAGVQLRADWGHTFNDRWSATASIAGANTIFPSWLGQVGVSYLFPKEVELGVALGYRKNYTPHSVLIDNAVTSGNMYNLRLSAGVYREQWRVHTHLDGFMLNSTLYANLNAQFRYYPLNDGNTYLMASAGVGTAPEMDFVDRLMPGSFEDINASLAVGGMYMVSKHLSLGLTASYHYFYNQSSETTSGTETNPVFTHYKNLYELYAQLIFCF